MSVIENDLFADCAPVVHGPACLAPVVFICDHASAYMPARYDGLGLSAHDLADHIAWDPGALPVALGLGARMDACVVAAGASRLLVDVNRALDAPDIMRAESEGRTVPGNASIDSAERAARLAGLYEPFHGAVTAEIDRHLAASIRPLVVSVHSFTPVYFGEKRSVEIGLLHDGANENFAMAMRDGLSDSIYDVQLNAPYGVSDGVLFTLSQHASVRGLPSLMLEIRNDLIADEVGQNLLAEIIHKALAAIARGAQDGTVLFVENAK